jgi:hypothetical protein
VKSSLATVTLAMVLASTAASADPITITRDQRSTTVVLNFFPDGGRSDSARANDTLSVTATAPPPWNIGARATLFSSFTDPLHWSGTGTANLSWAPPGGDGSFASSQFIVNFDVTSPVSFAFNEQVSLASSGCCASDVVGAFAHTLLRVNTGRIDGEGDPIFDTVFSLNELSASHNDSSTVSPTFTGLLSPGEYFLFLDGASLGPSAQGPGSASTNFAFTLDFAPRDAAPTPEPASLLLLGTGLAAVVGFRFRRANRAA